METPDIGRRHLAILVPSTGRVHTGFCFDLVRAVARHLAVSEDQLSVFNAVGSILPKNRNQLAQRALDAGATTTIWLDSDMRFPPDLFERLLEWPAEIVGVNYARRMEPVSGVAYGSLEPGKVEPLDLTPGEGLVEVGAAGLGATRVDSVVYRRMERPWFEFMWSPASGNFHGEDVVFCLRAREAGIPIHVDLGLSEEIGHIGDHVYTLEEARAWTSLLSED